MKRISFLFLSVLFSLGLVNVLKAQEKFTLFTPYDAVVQHIRLLAHDYYKPEQAVKCLDVSEIPLEEGIQAAIQLKRFYKAKGYYINFDDLPTSHDFYDSIHHDHRYYPVPAEPKIYLKRVNGEWKYSSATVHDIQEMYDHVFPFGTYALVDYFKNKSDIKLLGFYYWQYLEFIILVVLSVLLYKFLSFLLWSIFFRITNRWNKIALSVSVYKPLAKTVSFFFVMIFLSTFIVILQLPILFSKYQHVAFKLILPLSATYIIFRLLTLIENIYKGIKEEETGSLERQLVPIIRKFAQIVVVIIGIIYTLQNLDFNVTTLLAGISIGGLAFALAAQDTIKNLFGSLMIFMDKPFKVGDYVVSTDIAGTVEEVGFRSSRIRTPANSVIYVPNAKIADAVIDNLGLRQYRRFITKLGVTYSTPRVKISAFIEDLRAMILEHPYTRKEGNHIYLNDFDASALTILFIVFFETDDYGKELGYRHEIMLSIIELSEKHAVSFAFPTQTLHLESVPKGLNLDNQS